MGPLPPLPLGELKWVIILALIGIGAIVGLGITGVVWLFDHVRFI